MMSTTRIEQEVGARLTRNDAMEAVRQRMKQVIASMPRSPDDHDSILWDEPDARVLDVQVPDCWHQLVSGNGKLDKLTDEQRAYRHAVADNLERNGYVREAERYCSCGRVLGCQFCRDDPNHDTRLIVLRCGFLICPYCARRRGFEHRKRYKGRIQRVMQAAGPQQADWVLQHVTLTTRVMLFYDDVGERISRYYDLAIDTIKSLLPDRKGWGWVASFEFGQRGKKLHFHFLVWGPPIRRGELLLEWKRRTWWNQVHVREVKDAHDELEDMLEYQVKFTELKPEQMADLLGALKGKRVVRSGGVLYGRVCLNCYQRPGADEEDCPDCGEAIPEDEEDTEDERERPPGNCRECLAPLKEVSRQVTLELLKKYGPDLMSEALKALVNGETLDTTNGQVPLHTPPP